jgi:Cytochrome P450
MLTNVPRIHCGEHRMLRQLAGTTDRVRHQAEPAEVHHRERVGGGSRPCAGSGGGSDRGGREPRGAGQQRAPPGRRCRRDRPLEQLARHPEAEPAFQLAAPSTQRQHPGIPGAFAGRREQGALTDPSRPFDQQHPAVAAARGVEQAVQRPELTVTLHQPRRHPVHAAAALTWIRSRQHEKSLTPSRECVSAGAPAIVMRPPGQTLSRLPFTRAVITEALRQYGPVWILPRRALADVELGGHLLRAGSRIFFSPYALNRDPQLPAAAER